MQNFTPDFRIELPPKIESFEEFVAILEPLMQNLERYLQSEQCLHQSTFDSNRVLHFAGALVQNLLKFYQDDRVLLFILEDFSRMPSTQEILQVLLPQTDNETTINWSSLALEFILTYQHNFNPFADLEDEYLLSSLEKLINEYEAIIAEFEGENRLSYFERMGASQDLKNRVQFLLSKVRSEIENTFFPEEYSLSDKSLSSFVMGGDLRLVEKTNFQVGDSNHPDEVKLREFLISEYHSLTNDGLEKIMSDFVEQKSKKLSVSLYTAILLSIVYTNYSKVIGEIEIEALEKIIDLSRVIPFPTATGLQILNYRYIMAKALDLLMEAEIDNCKPLSAFNDQTQDFDLNLHEKNQNSRLICTKFLELYNAEAIQIRTSVSKKLSLHFDQLTILNNIFQLLNSELNQARKENCSPPKEWSPSLEKMDSFFKQVENVPDLNQFAEFVYLSKLYNKLFAGWLAAETNSAEKEFFSPKFGKSTESDEKMNLISCEKDSTPKMKNSDDIEDEISLSNDGISQGRQSTINKHIDYDQIPNESEYVDPDWSRQEVSSHLGADIQQDVEHDQGSNSQPNQMMEIEPQSSNREEPIAAADPLIHENYHQNSNHLILEEEEKEDQRQKRFMEWEIKFNAVISKLQNSDLHKVLTVKELEDVLDTANELNITEEYDRSSFQMLQETWNEIESFKKKFDSSENDLNLLRRLYKGLSVSPISWPELEDYLKETIELNEQVIIYLENSVTTEQLFSFMEKIESKTSRLDPNLYSQIKDKSNEANRLLQLFQELQLPRKTYQYDEVKTIKSMLSSLKSFKIEIVGQDLLKDVAASFSWLLEFDQIIRKEEQGDSFGANNASCDVSFDALEEEFDTEEVIEFCTAWLSQMFDPSTTSEALKADLKRLSQAGEVIRIADRRIESLFKNLSGVVWQFEIHNLSSGVKAIKDCDMLIDVPEEVGETIDSNVTAEIQEESERIKSWNALYEEVITDETEDFLRNKAESTLEYSSLNGSIKNLKWKLQRLLVEYEIDLDKYSDFSEKIKPVRKLLGWIDWLIEAKDCTEDLENPNANRLKQLQKLALEAPELEIPKNWASYSKVVELFTLADAALGEYKQKFQYVNSYEKWTQSKGTQKESIHKFLEKSRAKPSVSEAQALISLFAEKLFYIDCQEEIVDLDRKVEKYQDWKAKLDFFATNDGQRVLPATLDASSILEDIESIELQLNQLYAEYSCLDLRNDPDEKFLLGLECQVRAYKLVKGISRNPTIEEWKSLLKHAEENPNIDSTEDQNLTKLLRTEIENAKVQKERLKELRAIAAKGQTSNVTLEGVNEICSAFDKGLIRDEEDEKFMNELIQKIDQILTKVKQLCSSTMKEPINEFTSILDQIKRLPITLAQEEKELEEVISSANQIAVFIRKNPNMNAQNAEKTIKEYSNCPILIPEAQKLQDKYESSRQKYEAIITTLTEIFNQQKQLDYHELKQLSEQLSEIPYDFEDNLTLVRAKCYALRIEYLKKLADSFDTTGKPKNYQSNETGISFKIDPQNLELLTREGITIREKLQYQQKKISDSLNRAVFWMESLNSRIKVKIKEINTVSKLEILERMPQIMLGFVDLSQQFADRKAQLQKEISEQKLQPPPAKALEQKQQPATSISDLLDKDLEKISSTNQQTKRAATDTKTLAQPGKDKTSERRDIKPLISNITVIESKKVSEPPRQIPSRQNGLQQTKENEAPRVTNNSEMKSMSSTVTSEQVTQLQKSQSDTNSASVLDSKVGSSKKDQNKTNTNTSAVMTIRDILQSCPYLSLDLVESVNVANQIVKSFPLIQEDSEKLNKFSLLFRKVLNYPKICAFLHKNSFPGRSISKFLGKPPEELSRIENTLENVLKENINRSTPQSANESQNDPANKKKVKTETNSVATNIIDKTVCLTPQSQKTNASNDARSTPIFGGSDAENDPSVSIPENRFISNFNQNSASLPSAYTLKTSASMHTTKSKLIGSQTRVEEDEESLELESEDEAPNRDNRYYVPIANEICQDIDDAVFKVTYLNFSILLTLCI